MEILSGLSGSAISAIRHCANYVQAYPGQHLFGQAEPAYGLYVIVSGKVVVYRKTDHGEVVLATLGPNAVFGEFGMLIETGQRTAAARAVDHSVILEIPLNPVKLLEDLGDTPAAIQLLQNLVCILSQKLKVSNDRGMIDARSNIPMSGVSMPDPMARMEEIRERLPKKGLFKKAIQTAKLKPGEYLCKHGDAADGFYFIHDGTLEVVEQPPGGPERVIDYIYGPRIAGELGFFAGQPRSASLRATENVEYSIFSGVEFAKMRKTAPEDALIVLHVAAQIIVDMILRTEGGY